MALLPFVICSQNLSLHHYDADDGLPSSEVYRVFPDKTGHLWFCTDRGIAFYDSYKFTKIESPTDDLVFLDGYCNEDGECWFQSMKNNFYRWDGQKLVPYQYNKLINKYYANWSISNFSIRKNEIVFQLNVSVSYHIIAIQKNHIDTISSSSLILPPLVSKTQTVIMSIDYTNLQGPLHTSEYSSKKKLFSSKKTGHRKVQLSIPVNNVKSMNGIQLMAYKASSDKIVVLCQTVNYLLDINTAKVEIIPLNFQNKKANFLTKVFIDKEILYIAIRGGGLYTYSLVDKKVHSVADMEAIVVSDIYKDSENNLWITSLNNGIYKINPNIKNINNFNTFNVRALAKSGDNLYLSFKNNSFGFLNKEFNYQKSGISSAELEAIGPYQNGTAIINEKIVDTKSRFNVLESSYTKDIAFIKNSYISVRSDGLKLYSLNPFSPGLYHNLGFRAFCLFPLTENKILIGHNNGLCHFDLISKKRIDLSNISSRVNSITFLKNNIFLLATLSDGIYIFDNTEKKVINKLRTDNGISSNTIYKIKVQNDSTFWAATNAGLNRIIIDKQFRTSKILYFDKHNGLSSNEVNCLDIDSQYLYVGTSKGLNLLDYKNLQLPNYKTKVFITNIDIISSKDQFSRRNTFQHNENNIRIGFSSFITNKSISLPTYQYCLIYENGKDTQWLSTDETSLQFTNLSPGNYSFLIKSRSRYEDYGEITNYHFSITPHFTQTLWFKILIALAIIAALFLIVFFRIQNIRNKAKFSQTIKSSQLDSLRNQMNPHFIFNALNSVQSLIYGNKVDDAGNFLGKVSRMFRDALEFSRTSKISLNIEIEFIERYLQIEKLRFPNKLTYQIVIDPELMNEADIHEIPPLLMQPLVENSVKHGLKNIDYVGNIIVQMIKMEDAILYSVEDNCLGIPEQTAQTHTSRGLSIIKDRIDILNQLEKHNTPFRFEFINMPGKGVKAIITIPID